MRTAISAVASRVGTGLLGALVLIGCSKSVQDSAGVDNGNSYQIVYLAPSRGLAPCAHDPKRQCAQFAKEDALMKMKVSSRYGTTSDSNITNRITGIQLMVTPTAILPFASALGTPEAKSKDNLLWDHTALDVALAPFSSTNAQRSAERFMKNSVRQGDFVRAQSYLPDFVMFDIKGCEDYDTTELDKRLQQHADHPKYKLCEMRQQVFLPKGAETVWLHCNGRVLLDHILQPPICAVESYYPPGLVQNYFIAGGQLSDGSWRALDARLRTFVLSMQIKN